MKEDISQNLIRICLPIPFPLKTVNVYALIGPQGWTLVDTAIGAPDTRTAFAAALEQAGLQIERLQAIVLTHHHPDHIGLSGELQAQSGAPVYMHAIDKAAISIYDTNGMPNRFGHVSHFLSQHGLPATDLWFSRIDSKETQHLIHVPPQEVIQIVKDGDELELSGEIYTILWTPGHADGQICLYRKRDQLFLSADHVLPRITPNIGLYSENERINPLDDYLTALARVAEIPTSLVLPGHGDPFTDLAGRVHQIQAHHEEREQEILTLLTEKPQHATQLAGQLFGGRLKGDEAWRMGVAEVVAHLEYMRMKQLLQRQANPEGLLFYTLCNSEEKQG